MCSVLADSVNVRLGSKTTISASEPGTIAPGSDADIVVFDPNRTFTLSARTLHMKVDYNPYEGRQVTGATDTVLSRGRLVIENGKFVGRAGAGSFLKRAMRT